LNITEITSIPLFINSYHNTVSQSSTELVISVANSTDIVGNKLYIDPTGNSPIGFSSNSSKTTTGFNLFGPNVFWVSSDGKWESSFYAKNVSTKVWQIVWYEDATSNDGLPIALKTIAPASSAIEI
jgi:hypothetical protein